MDKTNTYTQQTSVKPMQRTAFEPRDASIGSVLFLVFQYAFIFLFSVAISMGLPATSAVETIASVLLEGMFAVTVLVVARVQRVRVIDATTLNRKPDKMHFVWGLGIALICLFCFTSLTNAFLEILMRLGYKTSDMQNPDSALTVQTFGQLILYTFTVAMVPAFTEEFLFRGLLLQGFKPLGKHVAVWLSAVLFMLMHGSPDQTVHQLILGVVLGYTFVITGSIYIPMFIHFLNNFIVLVINYIANVSGVYDQMAGSAEQTTTTSLPILIVQGVLLAVVGGVAIYFILKNLQNKQQKKAQDAQNAEVNDEEKPAQVSGKPKMDAASIICLSMALVALVFIWVVSLVGGFSA